MSELGASHRVNRRLSARVACRLLVSYHTGAGTHWHPATGMDLSNTGCRLRLGEDLPRGTVIKVRIECSSPTAHAMLAVLGGKIIWSRLEGLSYQVGIQFIEESSDLHSILQNLSIPAAPAP